MDDRYTFLKLSDPGRHQIQEVPKRNQNEACPKRTLLRQVMLSAFDSLGLCYLDQQNGIFGQKIQSALEKCPL